MEKNKTIEQVENESRSEQNIPKQKPLMMSPTGLTISISSVVVVAILGFVIGFGVGHAGNAKNGRPIGPMNGNGQMMRPPSGQFPDSQSSPGSSNSSNSSSSNNSSSSS